MFNIKIYIHTLRGNTVFKAVAYRPYILHFTLNNLSLTIVTAKPPIYLLSLWQLSSSVNLIRQYSITCVGEKDILSLPARVIID